MDLAPPGTRHPVPASPPAAPPVQKGTHLLHVHTRRLSPVGSKRAPRRLIERASVTRRVVTGRSARTGRVGWWWCVPAGTHPGVALTVTTSVPGTARVGAADPTPSHVDGPGRRTRASHGSEQRVPRRAVRPGDRRRPRCSCAPAPRDRGRRAVAERECRRTARGNDRGDRPRQPRYRPPGTGAGAGSGNRRCTTRYGADDGTPPIARCTGTMTAPRVDTGGSLLPFAGTEPVQVPGTVRFATEPRPRAGDAPYRPVTGSVVARRALFDRLAGANRVTQITAPPGSGKTQLLRSWIGEAGLAERAGWVSVQGGERDAQRFWIEVIEALRATGPGAGRVRGVTPAPELDGC